MLAGIYAPIPTPFINDEIAFDQLKLNLNKWEKTSLTGLVVLGSNGEFAMLDEQERMDVLNFVRENWPKERPLIGGTGAESTKEAIRLTRKAAEFGYQAALVLNPTYYKGSLNDAALKDYFLRVAEESPIPILIYNMPKNSGINMGTDLIVDLAQHTNIVGIKDSSNDVIHMAEIVAKTPKDFMVFAGSGNVLLPALSVGAVGGTLALANIMPEECVQLAQLFKERKFEEAQVLQYRLLEINAAITSRWGMAGLKAALDMLGYYGGELRKPLRPLEKEKVLQLADILAKARQKKVNIA